MFTLDESTVHSATVVVEGLAGAGPKQCLQVTEGTLL